MVFRNAYIGRLLVLILIFSVGVFADEEVGIPYIDRHKGLIESAVLSEDEKSFYTFQGEDLIHWNLSPLKKLASWKIHIKKIEIGNKKNRFHDIYFLDNYKKVLITSINELMIYNLQTNRIENSVSYRSHSIIKDGNFLYLTHPTKLDEVGEYNIDLEVWSIAKLQRVQSVNLTQLAKGLFYTPMTKNGNLLVGESVIFYFRTNYNMLILDKKSLQIKSTGTWLNLVKITDDGFLDVGKETYRLSDGSLITKNKKGHHSFAKEHNKTIVSGFVWDHKPRRYSSVRNLSLKTKKANYPLYIFVDTREGEKRNFIYIVQFDGELIIRKRGNRAFEFSSKRSKLLKMRTKDGEIIPMNNATFNKYNKTFNIGAD